MPQLFIHVRNSKFHSCDEGAEYERPEAALALGVRGAVAILADEVNEGANIAAAEVSVEAETGTKVLSSVVVISVSSLILDDLPAEVQVK